MPMPNLSMPSFAAIDLGLGGGLQEQLKETEEARKKRLMQQAQVAGGGLPPGGAVQSLFSQTGM
jgi:hypothetical protein